MSDRALAHLMAVLFLATVSVLIGHFAFHHDEQRRACVAAVQTPPRCRWSNADVESRNASLREAAEGWTRAVDIATSCVIDLEICRMTLEKTPAK